MLRKRGCGMSGTDVRVWGKRLYALFDRYKFVLLVLLAGVVLLLLPTGEGGVSDPAEAAPQSSTVQVEDLERRLEEALSKVDGAGEVTVLLTVKSSARQVLAQDGETTQRGDAVESSLTTVVVSRGSGAQEAVPLQQISPQYQGALVVCSGGGDPSVKLRIVEAVSALTGLGADKISVCKGK